MSTSNPANLIIPSGVVYAHATLPATDPDKPASYTIAIGKFENGVLRPGGDLKESFGVLDAGGIGLASQTAVKSTLTYEFDQKHFNKAMLQYAFGSTSGSAPAPGKVVDLYFYVAAISPGEGIDSGTGKAPFVHHSFKGGMRLTGDLNANGTDHGMLKLTISVYLAVAPGVWDTTRS